VTTPTSLNSPPFTNPAAIWRTSNSQKLFWGFFKKRAKKNKRFFLKKAAKTFSFWRLG
jgi:hypothetical protein